MKGIQDPPDLIDRKRWIAPVVMCACFATAAIAGVQDGPDGVVPLGTGLWVLLWILSHGIAH